jgi:hypothetical protein
MTGVTLFIGTSLAPDVANWVGRSIGKMEPGLDGCEISCRTDSTKILKIVDHVRLIVISGVEG